MKHHRSAAGRDVRLYTADEAAVLLRCKPSWLREQARKRNIPFTLVAGSYRFSADHLDQIIALHEHTPADDSTRPARYRIGRPGTPTPALLRARPRRTNLGSDDG